MQATRRADVTWNGPLRGGSGTVSAATSGLFSDVPVSWPRRIEEDAEGHTSPEELLAAAHATCYSMGLANRLAVNDFPAETLQVSAEVTIAQPVQWPSVVTSAITVEATVAGIDEETFQEYARLALETCPMSRAIAGNVELSVTATLHRP